MKMMQPRNKINPAAGLLDEVHDCLTLALDATERRRGAGYSPAEREARSYVRTALRRIGKIMEVTT